MADVLITGGSGFVGSWVARYLYKAGFSLVLLLRKTSRLDLLKGIEFETIIGDLTRPESLSCLSKPFDYIVHAGGRIKAIKNYDYYRVNTLGTENLIRVQKRWRVKRFVFLSSLAAAGPTGKGHPVSHYGRSKLLAEEVIRRSGIPFTILRLPVVYGPGDPGTGRLFQLLKRGVGLIPGRDHRLSLIYVEDVALFIAGLLKNESFLNQTVYHSDGGIYLLSDVLRISSFLMNRRLVWIKLPPFILAITIPLLDNILKDRSPITRDKVRELIEKEWTCPGQEIYRIEFDIEMGLRKTVDFFVRHDKI